MKSKIIIISIFTLYVMNIIFIYSNFYFLSTDEYKLEKVEYNLTYGNFNIIKTNIAINNKIIDKVIFNLFVLNSIKGLSVGKIGFENHYLITSSLNNTEIRIIKKGKYYELIYDNYLYYPIFPFLGNYYLSE